LSQSRFMNRQSLYPRPNPTRVVVRPFKPATEPRDLNSTDKPAADRDRAKKDDELSLRDAIERLLRPPMFEGYIPTFHKTHLGQALIKRRHKGAVCPRRLSV
jgi:hypothetical protein